MAKEAASRTLDYRLRADTLDRIKGAGQASLRKEGDLMPGDAIAAAGRHFGEDALLPSLPSFLPHAQRIESVSLVQSPRSARSPRSDPHLRHPDILLQIAMLGLLALPTSLVLSRGTAPAGPAARRRRFQARRRRRCRPRRRRSRLRRRRTSTSTTSWRTIR